MERSAGPMVEEAVMQSPEEFQEPERLNPRYPEYFVLLSAAGQWVVGREMARFIERELDRWPRRRWIRFVDVLGARVRLRTDLIRALRQSSLEIREDWRRFKDERQKESLDEPSDWDIEW
jgi:arginine/ornithine N-succinyltransferase beta subunit